MSWGCKAENYPDGCGWATRVVYGRLGIEEWWCDTCERDGDRTFTPNPARNCATGATTDEQHADRPEGHRDHERPGNRSEGEA